MTITIYISTAWLWWWAIGAAISGVLIELLDNTKESPLWARLTCYVLWPITWVLVFGVAAYNNMRGER
jgi:hypothetical protein